MTPLHKFLTVLHIHLTRDSRAHSGLRTNVQKSQSDEIEGQKSFEQEANQEIAHDHELYRGHRN